ncbi:MAG: hypothetical protein GX769_02270 [Erysipelothrix sp.]|nr:hypothetical protein [Erysipelothrix sp.]
MHKDKVIKQLKTTEIVVDRDYVLIPKNYKLSVYNDQGLVFIDINESLCRIIC